MPVGAAEVDGDASGNPRGAQAPRLVTCWSGPPVRTGGAARHIPFRVDLGRQLSGMHHFDLLNHRDV